MLSVTVPLSAAASTDRGGAIATTAAKRNAAAERNAPTTFSWCRGMAQPSPCPRRRYCLLSRRKHSPLSSPPAEDIRPSASDEPATRRRPLPKCRRRQPLRHPQPGQQPLVARLSHKSPDGAHACVPPMTRRSRDHVKIAYLAAVGNQNV